MKSVGYGLRNLVARIRKSYLNNVHVFASLTDFQRQKLVAEGYPVERIEVIPNMSQHRGHKQDCEAGQFIGYLGRLSPEKGVDTLIEAALKTSQIPFKAAGGYDHNQEIVAEAPGNFDFLGYLGRDQVGMFLEESRMIVLSSIHYEGFPMVLAEAMAHGRPVIASRLGGIPEIVEDGVTGLLFEPGNADDLAAKIKYLWERPDLCRQMGEAGKQKASRKYSPQMYYQRLMNIYQKAETICKASSDSSRL